MKNNKFGWPAGITLTTVTALLLGGCQKDAPAPAAPPLAEVGVFTVQPRLLQVTTELPGRTSPYLIAEVRPQVGGILQKRQFQEGSTVRAGQPLYQIDPAPYRVALARTEATFESAKLLFDRYEQLIKTRAISQQQYDEARSQYLQAKAAADAARIDVGYTALSAPISGRIGRSSVTQGALVTANQQTALATIQQLNPIYVDVTQSSTALLRLKEELAKGSIKAAGNGQAAVRLTLEDGRPYSHGGKLQFSEVTVDEGTGAVTLRAVFPNPDGQLLPGMFVRAELEEGVRDDALLVPQRGVTRDTQGNPTALVLDAQDTVQLRKVSTERSIDGQWLIGSGLQAGDRVVVDGVQNVRPGIKVKPVPAVDKTQEPAPALVKVAGASAPGAAR